MPPPPESLPVTIKHDVYPGIDPSKHYDEKTYKDKTVLITGASRGIGKAISLAYARAGAAVALVARNPETLASLRAEIRKELTDAKVETFVADVCVLAQVEAAVKGTIGRFGKIDICISNAGRIEILDKGVCSSLTPVWYAG